MLTRKNRTVSSPCLDRDSNPGSSETSVAVRLMMNDGSARLRECLLPRCTRKEKKKKKKRKTRRRTKKEKLDERRRRRRRRRSIRKETKN